MGNQWQSTHDSIIGPVHSVDLIWEPTRNVLKKRENRVAGNEVSGYQHSVNELGQRSGVIQTGSVFAAGQGIAWGYDALGQVTSAFSPGTYADRIYQYDSQSRRISRSEGFSPTPLFYGYYPRVGYSEKRKYADGDVVDEKLMPRVWTDKMTWKACPESIIAMDEWIQKQKEIFDDNAKLLGMKGRKNPFGGKLGEAYNLENTDGGRNCVLVGHAREFRTLEENRT